MPKTTVSEKLEASAIVQRLIENYGQKHSSEVSDGVATELNRIYKRLIKSDERLLQPKPRKPRKPKADVSGADSVVVEYLDGGTKRTEGYVNSNERWGRDGRKEKS